MTRPVDGGAGAVPTGIRAFNRPGLRQAWRGPSLLVLDDGGRAGGLDLSGFYFHETRHLSVSRLRVQGEDPVACSAAETGPDSLEFSFIYPPVKTQGGGGSGSGGDDRRHGILTRGLDLFLRFRVRPASVNVDLSLTSRWDDEVDVRLEWELAADFVGVLQAMGGAREQPDAAVAEALPGGVRFRCTRAGLPLQTRVIASGGGVWAYEEGALRTRLSLARQETVHVALRIEAVDAQDPIDRDGEDAREAHLAAYLARLPHLHAPAETPLVDLTDRALHELGTAALLDGPEDEWLMPAAGYPLYGAAFGRDAATASWQAGAFDGGGLARATAAKLARLQGTRRDDARDELPGRIVQQVRRDPPSRLGELPFDRYYGDVASPFMYVIALGNAFAWSGDRTLVERHWDPVRRVLDWAREHGDADGDGYIEYHTRSEHGPRHQGWKDSDNAVVDEHGRQVSTPFTPCEIQGYYMAALQFAAAFAWVMGQKSEARDLWRAARRLKERFNRDFWLPDEGFVAFGLDVDKRPLPVLTSNAGQCIATGIVADEHLPRLVRRIFQPDLFSGWGLRTLTTRNPAYNPLSYHLGSVWPVENGSILFGLRRYGFDDRALELARGLYDLARLWPGGRTPECVGGHGRRDHAHPGAYPRANSFQSWNQSVFPLLMQTLLGAYAVAPLHLLAVDPVLPWWLPEVTVKRWRIGEATATIRFWRDEAGKSHYRVLERIGKLRIVRQPPPESLAAGLLDRAGALAKSLLPF